MGCVKKKFTSIESAKGYIKKAVRAFKGARMRIYKCKFCTGFHLTTGKKVKTKRKK